MQEIMALLGIVAMMAIVAALATAVGWLAGGDDTWTWADAFRASRADRWPVGVQEDEPTPWRFEALGERRRIDQRPAAPRTGDRLVRPGTCAEVQGRTPAPGCL